MKAKEKDRVVSRKKHIKISKRKSQSIKNKPVSIREKPVCVFKRKAVNDNKKQVNNSRKPVRRNKNGHILSGSGSNGGGRPKGSLSGARLSEIKQAITRVELERRKSVKKRKFTKWIDHQIDKSYDDTTLAVAILNKIHPTLKSIEQVLFAVDTMDMQEAEEIRKEIQARCKIV